MHQCYQPNTQLLRERIRRKEEASSAHPNCSCRSSASIAVAVASAISLCTHLGKEARKHQSVGGKKACEPRSPRSVWTDKLDRGGWMKVISVPAHFRLVQGPSWTRVCGPGCDYARWVASGQASFEHSNGPTPLGAARPLA